MFYQKSISQLFTEFQTNRKGLTAKVVAERLSEYGRNIHTKAREKQSAWSIILFSQWKSPLIIILVVAAIISALLHEYIDMVVIVATIFINVAIGFFQEYKASSALDKLRQLVSYHALVMRDGVKQHVNTTQIVPGDILFVEAGSKIQADGRIIDAVDCFVNEAVLTGESQPVKKNATTLRGEKQLGDRVNMVYAGTIVTSGRAVVLVTATNGETEIGKIATLVQETTDEQTPLQMQLNHLARVITIIVVIICAFMLVFGVLFGGEDYTLFSLFETAVAVAVAAIPEGLVISLTVILAIGMQFILKRKALVRKLVAAETLGSVNVICTDKTGTLTVGDMRVTHVVTGKNTYNASELQVVSRTRNEKYDQVFSLLRAGVLCSDAVLQNPTDDVGSWTFVGDTTEVALVRVAAQVGVQKYELDDVFPRIAEIPFTSDNKFMATLHKQDVDYALYVKGAFDVLLPWATYYIDFNGDKKKLTKKQRAWFEEQMNALTSWGLRVLAIGYKTMTKKTTHITSNDIYDFVLLGLVGMEDPLRDDVVETIGIARAAGIRVIMVTGDYAATAQSIGMQLGLTGGVIDGSELENMSDEQLRDAIGSVSIFARVDPKHKIRIVQALQTQNLVVAMTGDGVNDAPALKAADIGIALGSGTDVAKETADMVILDDRFATIVHAVEEGRGIYENIKKVVLYLLAGSFSEVVMVTGSILAGLPLAALPVQILWVNIIEDGFPAIALAFDKTSRENMSDPPRKKGESLIDAEMRVMVILESVLSNVALFSIFVYFFYKTGDLALTRTIVFVGFAIGSLFFIFSIRSLRRMIWQMNPFSNMYLIGAVLFGWVMLLLAIYVPALQLLLRTVPLSLWHWGVMIAFGLFNILLMETVKFIFIVRRK